MRNFYDIEYVVRELRTKTTSPMFLDLVKQKLAVPGNDPVRVGPDRLAALRIQMDGRLKPVLRQ